MNNASDRCSVCGAGFVPRTITAHHHGGAELRMSCMDRHPGPTIPIPAGCSWEFIRTGPRVDAFDAIAAAAGPIPLTAPPEVES